MILIKTETRVSHLVWTAVQLKAGADWVKYRKVTNRSMVLPSVKFLFRSAVSILTSFYLFG